MASVVERKKMLKSEKLKKQIQIAYDIHIAPLEAELRQHQSKCKHKRVKKEHGGRTGNLDGNNYWTNFTCEICGKQWSETKYD